MSGRSRSIFKTKQFWEDYFYITEAFAENRRYPEIELRFPVSNNFGLKLEVNKYLSVKILSVYDGAFEKVVADHDMAHPVPSLFRWDELYIIGKKLAPQFAECPSVPFLLLSAFVAISENDDFSRIYQAYESAYQSLGIQSFEELIPIPDKTFKWSYHKDLGWVLNWEAHTRRRPDHPSFPFDMFNQLLEMVGIPPEDSLKKKPQQTTPDPRAINLLNRQKEIARKKREEYFKALEDQDLPF